MTDLATTQPSSAPSTSDHVLAIERPAPVLWTHYILLSLMAGPFFFVPLIFLRFRYQSLRYRFDDEGVSMSWGVWFRREIHLTYARIQDIHLVSNIVERWLGLARIQVQTASGSAKAEMTLVGLREYELVRDFLYERMRGTHARPAGAVAAARDDDAIVAELRRATEALQALQRQLAPTEPTSPEPTDDA
ncbi:MAG: PH domain-containing protein [Acidobacteriota bacterium]